MTAAVTAAVTVAALAATVTPGAAAQTDPARAPVIFLPGITGSHLQNPSGEVWPDEGRTALSPGDEHFDVLALQADGRTPASTSDPAYQIAVDRTNGISGVIDRVELCLLTACAGVSDVYAPVFAHLDSRGYRRGVDLFPFAFDWRRDVDANAALLLAEIDRVRARTGSARVNVVAHSQGGLVARAALADDRSVGKVARVATLGTPTLGATQFLGVLDYRQPCQSVELFGGCILNRAKAQELVTNWPGALALLPSRPYYQAYGSPINRLIDDDGDGRNEGYLSPSAVRARLADRNLALVDEAAGLHQRIDPWAPADPSVALTRFVGTGRGTIERVEEFLTERCTGVLWWRRCRLVETFRMQYGNGDGTVPRHSADVHHPASGLDLRGSGVTYYLADVSHSDLVKSPAVLDAVLGFLEAPAGPAAPAGDEAGEADRVGVADGTAQASSEPAPLNGVEITSTGPVTALVTDRAGRRTGTLDPARRPLTENVPGSSVVLSEHTSAFFLARPDRYRARWRATGDGDLTLQLRSHTDGEVSSLRSVGPIRVRAGGLVSLDLRLPVGRGTLPVSIDDDGDGRTDRRVAVRPETRGRAAEDRLAPTVDVTLRPRPPVDGQEMVRVSIRASDRGGSGVDLVEYAVETGRAAAAGVYARPFVVPARGTLHVRAVDRAGNVSAPYQRVPLG